MWWSRWPITGPPERLGDAATFRAVVAGLAAAGTIADASNLYWDVRPSARHGLGERLFDPVTGALVDARSAVHGLLGELEDDLREHGEWEETRELVVRLFRRGASAARQRRTFARTGDLGAVAAELICAQAPR